MKATKSPVPFPDEFFFTPAELEDPQAMPSTIESEESEKKLSSNDNINFDNFAESTPDDALSAIVVTSISENKPELENNIKPKAFERFNTQEYDEFVIEKTREFFLNRISQDPIVESVTVADIVNYVLAFIDFPEFQVKKREIRKKLRGKLDAIVTKKLINLKILANADLPTQYKLIETDREKILTTVIMSKLYPHKRTGYYIQENQITVDKKHKRKNPDYIQSNLTQEASNDNSPPIPEEENLGTKWLCTEEGDKYIVDGIRNALIRLLTPDSAQPFIKVNFTVADIANDIISHAEPGIKEKFSQSHKELLSKIRPIIHKKLSYLKIVTIANNKQYNLIENDVEVIKSKVTINEIYSRDRSYYHSYSKENRKKHKKPAHNQSDLQQADICNDNNSNDNYSMFDMEMEDQLVNDPIFLSQTTKIPVSENNSKLALISETQEKIIEEWEALVKEINDFTLRLETGQLFTPEELQTLREIDRQANMVSLLEPTTLFAEQEKDTSFGLHYFPFPAANVFVGPFRKAVLPGQLPLGQYGSLASLPLIVKPEEKGKYIFPRSKIFEDKESRQNYLTTYYASALNSGEYSHAAKCLLILFSHTLKHFLAVGGKNKNAFKIFINHELRKCGFSQMPKQVRAALTPLLWTFTKDKNLAVLYPQKDVSDLTPTIPLALKNIQKPEDNEQIEIDEKGVRVFKVTYVDKVKWGDPVDNLPKNAKLFKEDIDVYDRETGKLILAFRKKRLSREALAACRKELFTISAKKLKKFGARRIDDVVGKNDANRALYDSKSGGLGISSTKWSSASSYSQLTVAQGNAQLLMSGGKIMSEIEQLQQEIAPLEYAQVKNSMQSLQEITLPYCDIYSTIEVNRDKQTYGHRDDNEFPAFNYRGLTVFWPEGECLDGQQPEGKRAYEGLFTLFPNFDTPVAFDLEEGDILLADFDHHIHCNTKATVLCDTKSPTNPEGYYRLSLVGFTKGFLLEKLNRAAYENSDSESDLYRKNTPTGPQFFHRYKTKPYDVSTSDSQDNNNNNTAESEGIKRQKINTQHFFIRAAEEVLNQSRNKNRSKTNKSKRVKK